MKRLLIVLAACGGDDATNPAVDAASDAPPADAQPMFDPLVGIGNVETVRGGYLFTEGPQWRAATSDLVFSDINGNTIYSYPGTGAPVIHRMPSNMSNGLAVDNAGKLVAAEHGSRSVTRDGTAIASTFEGKQLNSPNDVIVGADGTIYFTDPPYGLPQGTPSALQFMGVFRIAPDGTLTAERRGATNERPNGIGIAPDGKTVFVADTADGKVYKYAVGAGGALGERQLFVTTAGSPDGLAIDTGGNVFVTTSGGVEVFSPTGTRWGNIPTPMQPANCAFGDPDARTLYITARTTLYRVKLANPGLPRN